MTMNKNMLSPVGFSFHIKKLPEMNFFVQSVTLPGIQIGVFDQPTPFKVVPRYGDHIQYGDLIVNFKINEDMGNYIEIFNWMTAISFPDTFDQYKNAAENDKLLVGEGLETDGYLMITSSAMNPNMRIDIEDLFPVALSDVTFDSRDTNIEYIDATVTFRFLKYTFTPV